MTGFSLNLNKRREAGQLSDELQSIVAKHRDYFDGKDPDDAATESDNKSSLFVL